MEEDKNKNKIFDDLFRNFFKEEINDLPKQNIDKPQPLPQKESSKNIASIINNLLSKDTKKTEKPASTLQKVLKPQTPVKKPIKSSLKKDTLAEIKEITAIAKTHIEGGSSEEVLNPVVLNPRSMEVDEILSYVPNWMIRWGITTIFLILMLILAMSYFIKYPDIIEGQITIVSNTPPASIVSKASGALQLYKQDREKIKEGEVIALIKNDARYDDVQKLKSNLENLKSKIDKGWKLTYFEFPKKMDLGSLQGSFSELVFSLKNQQVQKKIT